MVAVITVEDGETYGDHATVKVADIDTHRGPVFPQHIALRHQIPAQ